MKEEILRFGDRYPGLARSLPDPVPGIRDGAGSGRGAAGAGWRALLAVGRPLSPDDAFRFPRKTRHLHETPAPIPSLPALNDVAQLLPGTAWQGEA